MIGLSESHFLSGERVIEKMAVGAIVPSRLPPQAQLLCVNLQFTLVELWFVFVLELGSDSCQRFMHMLACFCIQAEMSRYTWHVVGYAILLKPIGFVSGWPEKDLIPFFYINAYALFGRSGEKLELLAKVGDFLKRGGGSMAGMCGASKLSEAYEQLKPRSPVPRSTGFFPSALAEHIPDLCLQLGIFACSGLQRREPHLHTVHRHGGLV